MIETKKYLDYEGLQQFWSLVKNYYSDTVTKAGTALQNFEVKYNGAVDPGVVVIDTDKKVSVDLSSYAKKSEIAKVFEYKGEATGNQLYNWTIDVPTTLKSGHIYTCSEDYDCPEPSTFKFHKGYEYVAQVVDSPRACSWVELGNWIDLSGYRKAADQDIIDNAIRGRLDVIEGEGDGSIKKALADAKSYADGKVATEAGARSAADATLQTNIDNEATTRSSADITLQGNINTEATTRANADAEIAHSVMSIEDYKIKQLFISDENKKTAGTSAEVISAINNMTGSEVVVTLTAPVALTERINVAAGKTAIINLNGQTLTAPANARALNVASGGYAAISGGTIASSNDNDYNIVVRGNGNLGTLGSTLILDGVTMTNSGSYQLLLATNGNDKDVNLVLNNCNFTGIMYLPALGSTTFNGGTFTATNAPVLYVKNGCPVELNNVNFTMTCDSNYSTNWAHFENGALDSPAALVVEACNYGGQGDPSVVIRDGKFSASAVSGEVFDILVINYNGRTPAKFDCNVGYYTSKNVTGHVTPDGTTAPTDGWLTFTSTDSAAEGYVTRH